MPAWDATSLLQPFSPQCSVCVAGVQTLGPVARVSVSRIVGHWAEKASVLGHTGSCLRRQCPPSDSATWAPPGTKRAVTPISHAHSNLLIAPFFPVSPGTTCAGTPWARPPVFSWTLPVSIQRPPVLAPNLSPLRTPVPLCVSLLGATLQLSTKESRGPTTFLPS